MVIDDLNLFGAQVAPLEDNAPLLVDAYGMETFQFTMKWLQTIAWWNRQITLPATGS